MPKVLIISLIFPIIFLFIFGLVLFDYIYFPLISSKAEKAAEKHLEEKYNEDFVIDGSSFSKPLGDDAGTYRIDSHPKKNPNLTVHISVTEDMEPMSDDYLDMKWRAELNKQFGSVYKGLYESHEHYSYMVNVSFPEETFTKYNISNTYQEIFEQEHKGIGNIVFANVMLNSSNEMDDQFEKVYKLLQYLKAQELEYFSIDINYFNEKLELKISDKDKKLNYQAFLNKHLKSRDYLFHFSYDSRDEVSKKKLEDIKSSGDLKQYLRTIKAIN
ncbi:murein transglycosylase [Paenibacillus sp. BSR1-1]|uniref:murein transglycosylase n=1 Tax=Paenibacillus sp. BSR1-1 TaxID=3020845 RepID=UPI0025B16EC5|nr:murein transglycosylase [Paenibacillus sp. BSR1-1]MDN3017162.1 murein transglycosylase [Paenibacillus sp. BSR1-1]